MINHGSGGFTSGSASDGRSFFIYGHIAVNVTMYERSYWIAYQYKSNFIYLFIVIIIVSISIIIIF